MTIKLKPEDLPADLRKLLPTDGPRKPSKHKNRRTEYGGRVYDSKAEAERAAVLDSRLASGTIHHWEPQVTIRLGPDDSLRVDFLVFSNTGHPRSFYVWAEDVKGFSTPAFKKKRKLWAKYGPFALYVIGKDRIEEVVPEAKS